MNDLKIILSAYTIIWIQRKWHNTKASFKQKFDDKVRKRGLFDISFEHTQREGKFRKQS